MDPWERRRPRAFILGPLRDWACEAWVRNRPGGTEKYPGRGLCLFLFVRSNKEKEDDKSFHCQAMNEKSNNHSTLEAGGWVLLANVDSAVWGAVRLIFISTKVAVAVAAAVCTSRAALHKSHHPIRLDGKALQDHPGARELLEAAASLFS